MTITNMAVFGLRYLSRAVLQRGGFLSRGAARTLCSNPPNDGKPAEEAAGTKTEDKKEVAIEKKAEDKIEVAIEKKLFFKKAEDKIEVAIENKVEDKKEVAIEKKAEDKIEVAIEKKAEDKIEVAIENKVEDKVEVAIEKKAEDKVEVAIEKKVEDKIEVAIEKKAEDKKEVARTKLNALLSSLATADKIPVEPISALKLSKPKPRLKKAKEETEKKTTAQQPPPEVLEPELVAATKEVAKSLGGDAETTESELLSTLRSHSTDVSAKEKTSPNLSELFVGLKVERHQTKPKVERHRRKQYDRSFDQQMTNTPRARDLGKPTTIISKEYVKTDLFGGRLNIFELEKSKESSSKESYCPTWDATHRREMELIVAQPPSNAFVEMIDWTKKGKLWQFPIDNEIGLDEEKKIGFQEHIFLERHLDGWCPRRGPIRHFMELVCTGLSKNPYLTVERKKAHIMWYKNYFEEKEELLKEIGAIEASQN